MSAAGSRKGIILAGGTGKRLRPITFALSKQLVPVYDKPMIYYPLTTLMLCGIRDILIISSPSQQDSFKRLLGNGSQFGLQFSYEAQQRPEGIAQAFLIGEKFLGDSSVVMVLGDNLFHGSDLVSLLNCANSREEGGTIFAYPVSNPEQYGVVQIDSNGSPIKIDEKPNKIISNLAVTGLYFYDNTVISRTKDIEPSSRGELEITSINQGYINDGLLKVEIMGRGMAWLDTGTFDSLQEAASYVHTLQNRQGLKIGCPEEVAWRRGWINDDQLFKASKALLQSGYGEYLLELLNKKSNQISLNNQFGY